MNKTIKTSIITMLLALSMPIMAFAGSDSDTLEFGDMEADAKLKGSFSLTSNDRGKATTEFTSAANTNKGYCVTAYVEARDSDDVVKKKKFDHGTAWAEANVSYTGTDSFGSTHTIANGNNVYSDLDLVQLSDY